MTPTVDASTIPELAVVLRAGRLSRFRVLDIACRRNGRLAQVLQTSAGLILLARAPHWEQADGMVWVAVRLNDDHPSGIEDVVVVQCSDNLHHDSLFLSDLREVLAAGDKRRIVYPLT